MFAQEAQEAFEQRGQQPGTDTSQMDWRWVERFRTLISYDSYWWLTWAGPFTQEEQAQWDRLCALPLDEPTKTHVGALMTASRERELEAALSEQREPRLHYPAIEMEAIRCRIEALRLLDAEIAQQEQHAIVRKLYHEAIEDEMGYLQMIEATSEGNSERFWACAQRSDRLPSREEMVYALGYVQALVQQGLASPVPATVQAAQQMQQTLRIHLQVPPEMLVEASAPDKQPVLLSGTAASSQRSISAKAAQRFFLTVLEQHGAAGWRVELDPHGGMARVERAARTLFLPDTPAPLSDIRHLFVHEVACHVEDCLAGERSRLGLLGVQMKDCGPTQEGFALYHESQILAARGESFNDIGIRLGMLAVGLASGVITPAQTFRQLWVFLEQMTCLRYALKSSLGEVTQAQWQAARRYALALCLRVYRGVPDLERAGVCYPQDMIYQRGLRLVEQAVAADASVLERLSVGVCSLAALPDLQALGILSAHRPLLHLASSADLDEYISSFEPPTTQAE